MESIVHFPSILSRRDGGIHQSASYQHSANIPPTEERLRLIRQLSSPTPEEAKEEIKPEPLEFDQEASLSVPPDPQRAPIDLDSMSPLQQMQLLKDLKDKLVRGSQPLPKILGAY